MMFLGSCVSAGLYLVTELNDCIIGKASKANFSDKVPRWQQERCSFGGFTRLKAQKGSLVNLDLSQLPPSSGNIAITSIQSALSSPSKSLIWFQDAFNATFAIVYSC